jgi:hypothetical protein
LKTEKDGKMNSEKTGINVRKNSRYDEERVREYIRYNAGKINDYLKLSVVHRAKDPNLSSSALAVKTLDSLQVYVFEIAHLMVGIRKNEDRLLRPAPDGLVERLKFEITVAKLMIGGILEKMGNLVLAKWRKEIFLSAEDLIEAIESLPKKDFYLTFKGTTYKPMTNRR